MPTRDGPLSPAVETVFGGHSGFPAWGVCWLLSVKWSTGHSCGLPSRDNLQPMWFQSVRLSCASLHSLSVLSKNSLQFLNGLPPQNFLLLMVSGYVHEMPVDLCVRVSDLFLICLFKIVG